MMPVRTRPQDDEAWYMSPGNRPLLCRAVDIWQIPLDVDYKSIQRAREVLAEDELVRASRFHFERDSRRFIVAHGTMRKILANYLQTEPPQLIFDSGERGKPEIRRSRNQLNLKFNLSHSGDLALLAVTSGASVGVDIETVNSAVATEEIAYICFSADEVKELLTLPKQQRVEAFFCCWTRKEAYIKAKGDGFSMRLDSFSVGVRHDRPAALISVVGDQAEPNRWSVYDVKIDFMHKAALVIEGRGHKISRLVLADGL